jgi:hypothetical protein
MNLKSATIHISPPYRPSYTQLCLKVDEKTHISVSPPHHPANENSYSHVWNYMGGGAEKNGVAGKIFS